MHEITESQRRDLLNMLEWAEKAIRTEIVAAEGKPWEEALRYEVSAVGAMWDALVAMGAEQ